MIFSYDAGHATCWPSSTAGPPAPRPTSTAAKAQWIDAGHSSPGTAPRRRPRRRTPAALRPRPAASPSTPRRVDRRLGDAAAPTTRPGCRPTAGRRSRSSRATTAFRVDRARPRAGSTRPCAASCAVAAYDRRRRRCSTPPACRSPACSTTCTRRRRERELGPIVDGGTRPTLSLWAPDRPVRRRSMARRAARCRCAATAADGVVDGRPGRRSWKGRPLPLRGRRSGRRASSKVVTNLVTDPYSVALTTNSRAAWSSTSTTRPSRPTGWSSTTRKPRLAQPEDRTVYELHVRDFSIDDATVPGGGPGHLPGLHRRRHRRHAAPARRWPTAGLTTVHLLPAFDIATIEEDRPASSRPPCDLASYAAGLRPSSRRASTPCAARTASTGATTRCTTRRPRAPTPPTRTGTAPHRASSARWCRALNGAGLRVVMDVVYNHTAASGQDATSVLDRVVPGYYQRLDAKGAVETSHLLPEHRHRARDDGEADDRLGASPGRGSTRSTASAST